MITIQIIQNKKENLNEFYEIELIDGGSPIKHCIKNKPENYYEFTYDQEKIEYPKITLSPSDNVLNTLVGNKFKFLGKKNDLINYLKLIVRSIKERESKENLKIGKLVYKEELIQNFFLCEFSSTSTDKKKKKMLIYYFIKKLNLIDLLHQVFP